MRRASVALAVLVVLALLVVESASSTTAMLLGGSTYYVSQGGSGTVCGSLTPCSLSTGMSKLLPGDTLRIVGILSASVTISKSGTAGAHIKLQGGAISAPRANQNALLVSGSYVDISDIDVSGGLSFGVRIKGHHVTLSNFSVHDSVWENRSGDACIGGSGGWGRGVTTGPTAYSVEIYNGRIFRNCGEGLAATQSHDIYFHDLEVFDNFSRGVYIGNAPFVTVERIYAHCENPNFFRSGRPARGIGLAIETTNYSTFGNQLHDVVIRDSTVENCLGTNFYSEVSGQYPSDVLVARNRYVNVPAPAISIPGTNIVIVDNVIGTATPSGGATATASRTPAPTRTRTPTPTVSTLTPTPTLIPCPPGWELDRYDENYVYCKIRR